MEIKRDSYLSALKNRKENDQIKDGGMYYLLLDEVQMLDRFGRLTILSKNHSDKRYIKTCVLAQQITRP